MTFYELVKLVLKRIFMILPMYNSPASIRDVSPIKVISKAHIATTIRTPAMEPLMIASMAFPAFSYSTFTAFPSVRGFSTSGKISFAESIAAGAKSKEAEMR